MYDIQFSLSEKKSWSNKTCHLVKITLTILN